MADISRAATASSTAYPILKLNEAKEVTPISKSAAFTLDLSGGDYKTVILMNNAGSASANVVFSGVHGTNLTVAVAATKTKAITLDSRYFKNMSGTAKDAVTITPSAAISFTVVELPQ